MSSSPQVARWPVSPPVLYLAAGVLIGPLGLRLLEPGLREHGRLIEAVAELAVVLSLFCVGLRLRTPFEWASWRAPVRLATVSMLATVLFVAGIAHVCFGLTFAQGLLLGAILAPVDPVLASNVQLPPGGSQEAGRSALVAEGVLSQPLAFPFVLLGLGLVGMHDPGPLAARWVALDIVWAVAAGAGLGWFTGAATARWLLRLDQDRDSPAPEILLGLGALILSYGAAAILGANGFVAVLAAGLALGRRGRWRPVAGMPCRTPSVRLAGIARRLEHLVEVTVVLMLGAMLALADVRAEMFLFALVFLAVVRPLAARLALVPIGAPAGERALLGWFGVRGIASIFYLMFAINHGLEPALARELTAITLVTVVTSIVLHNLSATPLLGRAADQRG